MSPFSPKKKAGSNGADRKKTMGGKGKGKGRGKGKGKSGGKGRGGKKGKRGGDAGVDAGVDRRNGGRSSSGGGRSMKREASGSGGNSNVQKFDEFRMKEFRLQLLPYGLDITNVESDGNCLFRAVSDQLSGNEGLAYKLRQDCVDYLEKNIDFFKPFVDKDEQEFEGYCRNMRKDGIWAGNLELQALSKLLKVNIRVHQLKEDGPSFDIFCNFGEKEDVKDWLQLSYHCQEHFASVRPIGRAFDQPAGHKNLVTLGRNNKSGKNNKGNDDGDRDDGGESGADSAAKVDKADSSTHSIESAKRGTVGGVGKSKGDEKNASDDGSVRSTTSGEATDPELGRKTEKNEDGKPQHRKADKKRQRRERKRLERQALARQARTKELVASCDEDKVIPQQVTLAV